MAERFSRDLAKGNWTSVKSAQSSPNRSAWKFTGRDGKAWTGTLTVQAVPAAKGEYIAKLTVARAG